VAGLLLLIPVKGRLGYGIAVFAGLAAIPNLWRHYIGSVVFAALLVVGGLVRRGRENAFVPDEDVPADTMRRLDDPATQRPSRGVSA
jgi:hypothetical protein